MTSIVPDKAEEIYGAGKEAMSNSGDSILNYLLPVWGPVSRVLVHVPASFQAYRRNRIFLMAFQCANVVLSFQWLSHRPLGPKLRIRQPGTHNESSNFTTMAGLKNKNSAWAETTENADDPCHLSVFSSIERSHGKGISTHWPAFC